MKNTHTFKEEIKRRTNKENRERRKKCTMSVQRRAATVSAEIKWHCGNTPDQIPPQKTHNSKKMQKKGAILIIGFVLIDEQLTNVSVLIDFDEKNHQRYIAIEKHLQKRMSHSLNTTIQQCNSFNQIITLIIIIIRMTRDGSKFDSHTNCFSGPNLMK
jgi:hypothetical protein